ncbi:LacI family DNA-binding transcriptional regulator [Sphingomonas sp. HF-S4]|uniref:LacI family DNA-binding transcriptional regulator n=1 Tax=Sphingomonas agrestis TaxID=3080540 RepID=A0ABU3Y441_9SPHN|nr:LacI family DNA-binding transcriptional regulator [Sphingomonas sp. HF-S4]MDV3456167.1 LacI family DNA-binding transcriptional regulator [Sphingomonas sp. HF-S4]
MGAGHSNATKRADPPGIVQPTMDDVAALAGVARATVSRVLSNHANVRAEVRERVMHVVAALDYRVNPQARGLASKISKTLVLVHCTTPDAEPNSYYDSALELGALRAAAAGGFELSTLSLFTDDPRRSDKLIELLASGRCAGAILTPPMSDDVALARRLVGLGYPAVCVAPGDEVRGLLAGVGLDEEAAGHEMGAHVVALGHRRLGYVLGIEGHRSAELRYAGFLRAVHDAGLPESAVTSSRGDFTFRAGVLCTQQLLDTAVRPSAIICANDDMAVGALFAAHRMNLAVPAELSIVGFDDAPISAHTWPPLTTVHQPVRRIAARAVDLLVEMLRHGMPAKAVFESVEHRLVLRESAAEPRD